MTQRLPFAFPLIGPRLVIEPDNSNETLIVRRRESDERVGCVEWRADGDTFHIVGLSIDAEQRGYGAGSESARLVIDAASEHFARLTAWAPPHLGLAVYFWIRMGLKPVPGEGPDGGLLFQRTGKQG